MGHFMIILEQDIKWKFRKITQRITAGLADEVLAEELNCNKKGPMLILKRIGYDQKGEVFEYTEGQYVASRYEYYMELNK